MKQHGHVAAAAAATRCDSRGDRDEDSSRFEPCADSDDDDDDDDDDTSSQAINKLGKYCVWLVVKAPLPDQLAQLSLSSQPQPPSIHNVNKRAKTEQHLAIDTQQRRKAQTDNARTSVHFGRIEDVPSDHTAAIVVAGFSNEEDAHSFLHKWKQDARGPFGRFARAIELIREQPTIHMFVECSLLFMLKPEHWIFTIRRGVIYVGRIVNNA